MATLNIVSICGTLRKGSFNAMVQRALPALAPEGMSVRLADLREGVPAGPHFRGD